MIVINSIWICSMESIWTCSMESMWTCPWNPYWICPDSIWNPVESMWNSDGFHMELTIPWSFHMESMMSMEQWIGSGPSQHSCHGFHMELLMDSIWINPGKVKTSQILKLAFSTIPADKSICWGHTPGDSKWKIFWWLYSYWRTSTLCRAYDDAGRALFSGSNVHFQIWKHLHF